MSDHKPSIDTIRHSLAHILAAAIAELYPEARFGVGPVVENGFYYDMALDTPVAEADLIKIQKKMTEIIARGDEFVKDSWTIEKAKKYFSKVNQTYKVELLDDLARHGTTVAREIDARELGIEQADEKNTTVTVYRTGDFVDLCRGPHVASSKELGRAAFMLTKVSGAYWRGDEKRDQLQRIYGVAFESKEKLNEFKTLQEEAKKRDHRKLGAALDLFTFSDLVGSGLPMYTPRGTIIINELKQALLAISKQYGMQQVSIPHLAKIDLYKTSGHAQKFENELFRVSSHYKQEFVLKPVNCPHHTQIYAARPRSYRDLPLRFMESTAQYRDEKPGEIGGLTRTRGFTVDDGHIFCTVDQIEQEATNIVHIIREFYQGLGMWGDHWVSLSVRDMSDLDSYIGEASDWDRAEEMLEKLASDQKLEAKRIEGEAAIYGPKLDFMFRDALGNERQLATIQLDFAMPKRFDLSYIAPDGSAQTPVMIHRAILGSYERFLAILIEHYDGAFPLWLAPEQVRIIPISEKFTHYATKVATKLVEDDIRVTVDDSNDSLGKRIRNAETYKVPYILVVGEKESLAGTVAIRHYRDGDMGTKEIDEFFGGLHAEIYEKR